MVMKTDSIAKPVLCGLYAFYERLLGNKLMGSLQCTGAYKLRKV